MSTRIKSAAVAIIIAVVLLLLHNTFLFNMGIAFIAIIGLFELFRATGMTKHKGIAIASYVYSGISVMSVMRIVYEYKWLSFIMNDMPLFVYVLVVCFFYLKNHKDTNFKDAFFMLGSGVLLTRAFVYILSIVSIANAGVFLLVLTLCGAWLADSGAYFAGTFFGKTKLCPEISPKKTVEGLIGGVITNGVLMLVICVFYANVIILAKRRRS